MKCASTARIVSLETIQTCDNLLSLVNCPAFYSVLEQFRHDAACLAHERFLQLYLNDAGYVDIWRIPHMMLDAVQNRLATHKLQDEREFRRLFHGFLTALYDWCSIQVSADGQEQGRLQDTAPQDGAGRAATSALSLIFLAVLARLDAEVEA